MPEQQPVYTPQPKTNGMAIAALVLGILSIVIPYIGFILGIIAIILGKKSRRAINENHEGGSGLAIAGFVCGLVGLCFWVLIDGFVTFGIAAFFSS